MTNLDNLEEIKKVDTQNVLGSIEALPNQCLHAWEEASKVKVPDSYRDIENIVMCGMGGSGLGARIIESVYSESLNIPLVRINDYHLPGFANENTLLICSSYSGETEETVACFNEGIKKGCKLMSIGTGGTLIDQAQKRKTPHYKIDPKYNPSKQPRMAIGYSIIGQLLLASKVNLFKLGKEDVLVMINSMKSIQNQCKVDVEIDKNSAKKLAKKMLNKNVYLISSHHLVGATHVFNNQLNENSKVLTADYQIPELNHHLMEGLKRPGFNKENAIILFLNSELFTERIRKRIEITKDVVQQNKIQSYQYKVKSPTKLSQAFELIQFGAFVNFYLAMLYNQDPAPIPWVDYFKKKLGQPLGK